MVLKKVAENYAFLQCAACPAWLVTICSAAALYHMEKVKPERTAKSFQPCWTHCLYTAMLPQSTTWKLCAIKHDGNARSIKKSGAPCISSVEDTSSLKHSASTALKNLNYTEQSFLHVSLTYQLIMTIYWNCLHRKRFPKQIQKTRKQDR